MIISDRGLIYDNVSVYALRPDFIAAQWLESFNATKLLDLMKFVFFTFKIQNIHLKALVKKKIVALF